MNFNLSRNQFFLILFIVQSGSSFFSFPSPFVNSAGRDAWLVFFVVGAFHYLLLLFYEHNYKYFKIGPFVGWLYKLYWLFVTIVYIAYIDYTLAVWGFPETPQFIVIAVLVSVSLYANLSRAETVINLSVMLIPLILLFLLFLQFAWKDLVWTNLFPIGESTGKEWAKGLLKAQLAFIGSELFLLFRKHVDSKQQIKGRPLFFYQLVWFTFFFFSVVIVLLYFTRRGLERLPEPLLFLLKAQEVTFVERLDLFFLYIWTVWTIITVVILSFAALYVHRLHFKHHKRDIIIWHVLLVLLPLLFLSKHSIEILNDMIVYVYLLFGIFIPLIVVLMNRRKQK